LLVGNFRPAQTPDQFFGFARKHGAANDFNPTAAGPFKMWFEKHSALVLNWKDRRWT